jgi:metal-dependent hydrolase (beta-lactamase superfamily II)
MKRRRKSFRALGSRVRYRASIRSTTGAIPEECRPQRAWSRTRSPKINHWCNTPEGLVVITGCGHAGIINILTFARGEFPNEPVEAVIGGLHLFQATDEQLNWTADKLKDFKVANLIGAHCTGIEAVYRIRERLALPRESAVVGSVGSSFVLGEGIHPGPLAK